MTEQQKNRIIRMRRAGLSYNQIADELDISKNTVSTFCRRNGLTGPLEEMPVPEGEDNPAEKPCRQCGKPVAQTPGRKEKKFCSDLCRNKWWNAHLSQVKREAMYAYTCPACGGTFYAYGNRKRKYCSHQCYIEGRFGGAACE